MKEIISFKLKDGEYYYKELTLLKKVGDNWELVNGMVDFGQSKQWFENGLCHRKDGPAHISEFGEVYYWKGRRHRENGPAVVSGRREEFYLNGKIYKEEVWKRLVRKLKLAKLLS